MTKSCCFPSYAIRTRLHPPSEVTAVAVELDLYIYVLAVLPCMPQVSIVWYMATWLRVSGRRVGIIAYSGPGIYIRFCSRFSPCFLPLALYFWSSRALVFVNDRACTSMVYTALSRMNSCRGLGYYHCIQRKWTATHRKYDLSSSPTGSNAIAINRQDLY